MRKSVIGITLALAAMIGYWLLFSRYALEFFTALGSCLVASIGMFIYLMISWRRLPSVDRRQGMTAGDDGSGRVASYGLLRYPGQWVECEQFMVVMEKAIQENRHEIYQVKEQLKEVADPGEEKRLLARLKELQILQLWYLDQVWVWDLEKM